MDQFNDGCLVIANDPASYHPVATNHFTVTFKLPATLRNYAVANNPLFTETVVNSPDGLILTLKLANDNIQEPNFSQQSLTYQKGNLSIEFPGKIDVFTSTAQFHIFVTKSAYDILYSWKLASGNHLTGEVGDPEDYWADVDIDVTTGNKGTLVGTWHWHNVWCSQLQGITFNNGDNSPKTCTITMKYFKPEWESASNPYDKKSN